MSGATDLATGADLAERLSPCGPVADAAAAARAFEVLEAAAAEDGWSGSLATARAALEPVFGASPYLALLAKRRPERLARLLSADPEAALGAILAEAERASVEAPETAAFKDRLRRLKGDLHLLTALCDLGGVWDLDQVTGALSRFADVAARACLEAVAAGERARGRLTAEPGGPEGPIPGLFGLAMGKHGAFELNYSSDIDVSLFYEPEALRLAEGVEPQAFVDRCARGLTDLLADRTAEGYVFRLDLRLRPDPASSPPVVSAPAAMTYYETVGQNWERAAFIKARPVLGDLPLARDFLRALEPFVWRRTLDFPAVADIHSIKRQIHVHKVDERLEAAGADLKLGRGGIREVEFYVQVQQLILGGRDRALRSPRTLEALEALRLAGHVRSPAARDLTQAYERLRALEHRVQMLDDEQTHRLPEDPERRRAVAALAGRANLKNFDESVARTLKTVNRRYGELFAEDEPLSSPYGSLVFTGVEDDPETLATLSRMGFSNPASVSSTIRAWHHGRIGATRTARGRELFTRLAPKLLEAARATGAPDAAFTRFAAFFSGLSAGVQIQSLFLAQPALFGLIVEVMAFAPRLAATLARRPAALDALLDRPFFAPLDDDSGVCALIERSGREAGSFEAAMDAVRRIHREQAFRIGVQVMTGAADGAEAGRGFADLADACVRALAPAALAETERLGGRFPGAAAVVALGKFGSRELTALSDLDLMTVYAAEDPAAASAGKGWAAETFYGRFTQRLIAALSAPTAEGGLYEIDMQLRPSGAKGPVAVSLAALRAYYAAEADTWELLALTRARVVWASDPAFGAAVEAAVAEALARPRDRDACAADVRAMRDLMDRERPPRGEWDLKLVPGGQVDCEFAAQFLQLVGAPLRAGTLEALEAAGAAGAWSERDIEALARSWSLHQNVAQVLRAALDERADPEGEPEPFRRRLARAGGVRRFEELKRRLARTRRAARAAFERMLPATECGEPPR